MLLKRNRDILGFFFCMAQSHFRFLIETLLLYYLCFSSGLIKSFSKMPLVLVVVIEMWHTSRLLDGVNSMRH